MTRRFRLAAVALAVAVPAVRAQDPGPRQFVPPIVDSGGPLAQAQASYDVRYYDLAVEVLPETKRIAGRLAVTATIVQPTDVLVLDLDTVFAVPETTVEGLGAVAATREGGRLRLPLGRTRMPGETVTATVAYAGAPRVAKRAPWDGGFTWATTADGQPWIATTVQGEGADLWWPCKDHPSDEPDSMAVTVTVPAPLVAVTSGRLAGMDESGGKRTYRWRVHNPINNYGLALHIGPYRAIEATYASVTGEAVPAVFYVLPEREADGRRIFPQFLDHVRFYERLLGPYPWRTDKFGVAHTPHLGMEHQSNLAYGSDFGGGPDGFDWLHHHELGHEWWGNVQTAWDWRDFWLHEGTCSYMQALYAEERNGLEGYLANLRRSRRGIANVLPLAPRDSRTTDEIYFLGAVNGRSNPDIYAKGAWVLHTLRFLVGRDALLTALRRQVYPTPEMERAQGGGQAHFATTDDFVATASAAAGRDLGWFFEVYARQPDLPRLVATREGNALALRWEVPGGRPFPMPVEVEVGGQVRRVEMPDGRASVPLPAGAAYRVDPAGWVLKAE